MKSEKINALITGGASGLGEATVRRIIDLGGTVTISDFQEERCLSLSDELGKNCVYSMTDVTNEESINKPY